MNNFLASICRKERKAVLHLIDVHNALLAAMKTHEGMDATSLLYVQKHWNALRDLLREDAYLQ